MHTLVSKLVALGVEKNYMALTKIQLKTYRFHGSLSQKGSNPCTRPCLSLRSNCSQLLHPCHKWVPR